MIKGRMYVSRKGVARRYDIDERTLFNWAHDEKMRRAGFPPPIKIRNRIWFDLEALRKFEAQFPNQFGVKEDVGGSVAAER